ncbi:MAG: hypothetical protein AAF086_06485 [Planctomycetota bacterium]
MNTLTPPIPTNLPATPLASAMAWRFTVRCPQADQVMLVTDDASGFSSWRPMTATHDRAGTWQLDLPESGIAGPVRYYSVEGSAVLNCGTAGLSATRIAADKNLTRPMAVSA